MDRSIQEVNEMCTGAEPRSDHYVVLPSSAAMTTDRQPMEGRGKADWAARFFAAATVAAVAAYLFREIVDGDCWWHVVIGKDIIARRAVPTVDAFSTLGLGRPYHDSHWLFQVFLATADRLGGMAGVSLAAVLLWAVTLLLCYRAVRRWVSLPSACALVFLAALGASDRFVPRPDAITCLMIAAFTLLLQQERWKRLPGLALIVLLQVVWANSHGLFVIGPFVVLCYCFAALIQGSATGTADRRRLWVLLVLTAAATLSTPFGLTGWRYAARLFGEQFFSGQTLFAGIQELAPTFGAASRALPDFWIFAGFLLAWGAIAVAALARGSISVPRVLVTAGLCVAACSGRRNMPLFLLAAAPFIAEHAAALIRPRAIRSAAWWVFGGVALLSALMPLSGKFYELMALTVRAGLGPSPTVFPAGLPAFLLQSGFKGQVFSPAYQAGYCLYHGYRPMVDTRWEVYDPRQLADFYAAVLDPARWWQTVVRYDIRGILLTHFSPETDALLPRLPGDPRWRLVWYDSSASFWVRFDQLPALATLRPGSDVDRRLLPSRLEECLLLARFYEVMGAYRRARECYERALGLGGKKAPILKTLEWIQLRITESEGR
jgi:hypothetical protein